MSSQVLSYLGNNEAYVNEIESVELLFEKKKQLKVLGILINYQREFAHGFWNERKWELADFTLVYNHASSTDNNFAEKSICFNHGYNLSDVIKWYLTYSKHWCNRVRARYKFEMPKQAGKLLDIETNGINHL